MPGTAPADESSFLQLYRREANDAAPGTECPGSADALAPRDRSFLLDLQRRALQYFLDNQMPGGLVLDRQGNHGPRRADGWSGRRRARASPADRPSPEKRSAASRRRE